MKLILALLLVTSLNAKIESDKYSHAFIGVGIYVGCLLTKGAGEALKYDMSYLTTKTCLIPVVVAGVSKEIYDANHDNHTAEVMDALATIAIPVSLSFVIFEW